MRDLWKSPPPRLARITADDSQQRLDIGADTDPAAWMWVPVTDGQQGERQRGYTAWRDVFEAASAWLHAETRAISGGEETNDG